jgi:superfamily II DNA or RNA helicase
VGEGVSETIEAAATDSRMADWQGPDSLICAEVAAQAQANLESYRVNPPLLEEQVNIELAAAEGGYGRRQLYELIQNGADALVGVEGGRIEVVLTDEAFYCANEGEPIDVAGVRAILLSHVSQKRGDEIGRFGLGFKSVLEVTDGPEFYSRSGSFVWDLERAKGEIAEAVPGFNPARDAAPRLRIAHPVVPRERFADDPVLAELSSWATTIVKLPFASGQYEWLAEDVAFFPAEFLLFCRHVRRLVLDNRSAVRPAKTDGSAAPSKREIALSEKSKVFRLVEDGDESAWTLFSTVYEPTEEAKRDAGTMSNRDRVPIHWALPLKGKAGPGVLWAFFPTEYETTLSGIVNAPWKTNPDRKNLLDGAFNRELLGVVARLVVEKLPLLRSPKDPGRLLDLMPARGREARNWADRVLTEGVYELAAEAPCLPDLKGNLKRPGTLRLHPERIPQDLLTLWAEASPSDAWCHPSVESRERRPRAERLIESAGSEIVDWTEWLEALVSRPTAAASKAAVVIAAAAIGQGLAPRVQVDRARIVLTRDGRLANPDPEDIFLPSDYDAGEEMQIVHPTLAADPDALNALRELGIGAVDAAADLEGLLREGFVTWTGSEWEEFWKVVRRVGPARAAGIIKQRKRTPFVRVGSGQFRPLFGALLPGSIVPGDGARDRDVLIDVEFHANDLELLRELGAVEAPSSRGGSTDESWFDMYRHDALSAYRERLPEAKRPQEALLDFEIRPFAGPLTAFQWLSDEGRVLFTEAVLGAETHPHPWEFAHTTRREAYPIISMDAPAIWRIKQEGRLRTSHGIRPLDRCASPALGGWQAVVPIAECADETAARLGLPATLDELSPALWEEALTAVAVSDNDELIGRVYAAACQFVSSPDRVRCRVGDSHALEPPENVTVVHDVRELRALQPQKTPTLLVSTLEEEQELQRQWGLSSEEKVETQLAFGSVGEEAPLIDRFPSLQWEIEPERRELTLVPCGELRLETITAGGRTAEEIDFFVDEGKVYFDESLAEADLLSRLGPVLGLSLDEGAIQDAIARRVDVERRRLATKVRQASSLEGRLLIAVGETALRSRLPKGLVAALENEGRPLDGDKVAELALAVYGVDVLRDLRRELGERGLQPPTQWAASSAALAFVRRLGFPREFAGFESPGRSPLLEVEGPPDVPPLHDFQRAIADEFRRLLNDVAGGRRGLLSLPTGAGKTRVAVDALIEAVEHDGLGGPILWITQSDELCEQAVQTWSFVWRGLGPSRARLTISRLWSNNEAEPAEGSTHVVVATIQKLQGCFDDPEYKWLAQASCVVIDEAHHSVAPSYTDLLSWLGLGRGRGTRPLVGLTATPFRGSSEEESKRLVARYGGHRLDTVAFGDEDAYPELQARGILAEVRHRVLGGVEIELTADELRMLERTRLFPRSAEDRLGLDVDRNKRLLEEIQSLPEDWTTLLFATSVDHAQTMAALLTLEGIPAKPITGLTESGARRHYVEQFRNGELRVLTNYAVLTQGFDAPAVRAIFVARPTYSPNLYQQMIGRGLRGPENGGKEECLIVNVEDNVRQFGGRLAFRDFEYLWNGAQDAGR